MSRKMGKKETIQKIREYAELSREKLQNSKDTGVLPKWAETVIRSACNGERLAANDVKARKSEKSDIVMYIGKKRVKLEVKCGAGAVFYSKKDGCGNPLDLPQTLEEFSENQILASADFVVYAPDTFEDWLNNPERVLKSCFVLTRQDFINLLLATTRGKNYGLKIDKARGQVTMCNLTEKKKMKDGSVKTYTTRLDRAWDFIESNNFPTVESWLKELGRL